MDSNTVHSQGEKLGHLCVHCSFLVLYQTVAIRDHQKVNVQLFIPCELTVDSSTCSMAVSEAQCITMKTSKSSNEGSGLLFHCMYY